MLIMVLAHHYANVIPEPGHFHLTMNSIMCHIILTHPAMLLLQSFFILVFRQARDVVKGIKKRLGNKNPDTQLYAVKVSN